MDDNKPALNENDLETWNRFIEEMGRDRHMKPPADIYVTSTSRKLDLHGYTLHAAWQAFNEFIEHHSIAGTKSVTVITGRSGQIVQEFKEWCRLSAHIRCYQPIITRGGTAGSFKVMINRTKTQKGHAA